MEATTKNKIVPKGTGALLNQQVGGNVVVAAKASDVHNPWMCQGCGAILGSVCVEKIRTGLSLSRLILFRMAVKVGELLPENLIFAKIDSGEVGCSRCGALRTFHPDPNLARYWAGNPRKVNRNL
jgi:hypothetical protein